MEKLKIDLVEICKKKEYNLQTISNISIPTPYIPYVPNSWKNNKILILFEAQNLSGSNDGLIKYKNKLSEEDSFRRLGNSNIKDDGIGITPWDEGWLDLPLRTCFPDTKLQDYAVGNAVLWSLSKDGKNINPTKSLIQKSAELWSEMLTDMNPNLIILVGNVAKEVISKASYKGKTIHLYFPYGRYASFVNKHFKFTEELVKDLGINSGIEGLDKSDTSPERMKIILQSIPMTVSLLLKKKQYE
jgi:hypothetical protein